MRVHKGGTMVNCKVQDIEIHCRMFGGILEGRDGTSGFTGRV